MRIPLSSCPCEDQCSWKLTKHGDVTIRSAYYAELMAKKDEEASHSAQENHGIWVKLRSAKLPPKIRHFGWRVLNGGRSPCYGEYEEKRIDRRYNLPIMQR